MNTPTVVAGPSAPGAGLIGLIGGLGAAACISCTNVLLSMSFTYGATPATFLIARYCLLLTLCVVWLMVSKGSRHLPRGSLLHVYGVGLTNMMGATALSFAIQRIPVGLAVVLLYCFPLITLLIECVLERRAPSLTTLSFMALAFFGLTLAVQVETGAADPAGIALALMAACAIAVSFVWSNRHTRDVTNGVRLLHIAITGLVCSVLLGAIVQKVVSPFALSDMAITLWLAALGFCAAYVFMFAGIARIGATPTAMLMNLEPPLTVLIAFLLMGDAMSNVQMTGVALVVGAVILVQRTAKR